MSGTTARLAIPYIAGSDPANQIDTIQQASAQKVDDVAAAFAQGTLAARPAAGTQGRLYFATDIDTLYYDDGVGWFEQAPGAELSAYRTLLTGSGLMLADSVAATYFLAATLKASGGDAGSPSVPCVKYLDDADYTISGRNTRLRVRGLVSTNATQPTITFTFGLYPVTFAGGGDALTVTLGAVVGSSTAAVASPAASSTVRTDSADFAVPADGLYALGVVTSATLTNNSAVLLSAELQQHWTS